MGLFTTNTKNAMLDAITAVYASLHSADPGSNGANELSGGSPAYARKACVFNAASAGSRALNANVTFDVPAGSTVAYVGYWDALAGSFVGSDAVTSENYAGQGQYTVTTTGTTLSVTD